MEENARQNYLQSRSRHPPDEAVRFVENQIAPSGQTQSVFHERVNSFVLVDEAERQDQISADLWKEADEEKEQLFSMMEKVREKLKKRGSAGNTLADSNLRHCKWGEVMSEVQTTATSWRTSTTQSTKMLHYIDKVGQNSKAFESWLTLLPAGDYGASIAGVFKVAIGAAGQYKNVEETIFKALSEIPEIMESARRYVQTYYQNRDHSLERKTFDLFRAILRALLHIMKFFADSKFHNSKLDSGPWFDTPLSSSPSPANAVVGSGKIWQPVLHQGGYKSELTDSIDEIKKQMERVQEEANHCLAERVCDNGRITLATNQNSETQLVKQETELQILRDIHQLLKVSPLLGLVQNDGLLHPNYTRLVEMVAASRSPSPVPEPPPEPAPAPDNSAALGLRLLEAIRYDPEVIAKDVQVTIQRGIALDEQPKAVAASLVAHPRFDAYFGPAGGAGGEPSSSALLVNGRMDAVTSDGVSPLGLVVAEVARTAAGRRGAYVVSYFCDRHRPGLFAASSSSGAAPTTVAPSSPVGAVVASFIGQLLAQMEEQEVRPDFAFLKDEDWLRLRRLNMMCVVFVKLVGQLPPGSVLLCMIDGASQYETMALGADMEALIRRLVRLVESQGHLIYKLLVTCRTRAKGIARYFEQDCIINLDGDTEEADSSGRRIASLRNAL
ncbi:hypothetical protein PG996_007972 [Apiospora saccharicola]|uniref:Exocyst complex component Sec10 n=1 Tax=Apiospora saccharicola TaxID=335842 RepID=A0ABR1UZ21_9PEZI